MATDVEFEAVLEFLRRNGFSECESALMEDVMDKSHQLGSSDFQKFLFPMAPLPPTLKIPATRRPPEEVGGGGRSSRGSSSDDEFVSLGSSTTELCSSEFTNPYGIRTTRPTSQASSDRMSQFGTARDYHDFDMQSDLFWYREKDEDYAMPPFFNGRDFDSDPSEDKFITTIKTETHLSEGGANLNDSSYKDYYELGDDFRLKDHCKEDYSCSAPLCACCSGTVESEIKLLNQRNSIYDQVGVLENSDEFNIFKQENRQIDDETSFGGHHEPESAVDEEGGAISDELAIYNNEDEYEIFDLRIIHRKNRTGFEENKELPIVMNSIIAGRYYVTEFLGSAAFSRVVQAHDLYSGMDVCLKIIKNDKDFFDQSLDEIKLLKFVNKHDPADERHILRLYDYFYHQEHLFIVTELLRANLYEFQKYNRESDAEPYFTMDRLQVITRQCLEAVSYLHDLGIIHCDLKPENILIKSYRKCEIKVIDLGSSCFQTDHLSLYVQSRSYRAPEVLLGLPYNQKIDLWSIGCILAELCSGEVLFPNEPVVLLLARMVGLLGPIHMDMLKKGQETSKYFTEEYDLYHINEDTNQLEYIIPEESTLDHHLQIYDPIFIDFLKCLLEINPKRRPTAKEALQHPWLSHSYEV
ncbi:hypothetical protein ACJIZ3_009574 [Penstemon smallii]|uniref:Protein kinase domain-containing protein n=1 Tax=Penstemon smallii TaxID=265156 RepID=A0ABD3TEN9_9LAMI